ncbi:MAG: DsrE family protein [bacterium]|nr:DsrE family protein [bacterium]
MVEKKSRICIVVHSSPEREDSHTLHKITAAALASGHSVQIFLMNDGVYHLLRETFDDLLNKGAEVTVCAHNAVERGVPERAGVSFGSQYNLAVMVAASDVFLSLH